MSASRREVAEAANVSLRTVSNVVNGFPSVAPATRKRVLEAIASLDYRPSEIARMLKRGRSGLVALVLPELDNPYFAELTRAFVEKGTEFGYTVVIDQTDGDAAREREFINQTERGALFDGLIVSPIGLHTADLANVSPDRPVIFLGEESHPGFDQVMIDNVAATQEAVLHLASLGHRRIAVIGEESSQHSASQLRLDGYRRALAIAGIPFEPSLVQYVDGFSRSQGQQAAERILSRDDVPDAIFCFSDPLALGALFAIRRSGLRVPEDILVSGFDDVEDGRFSSPTLTSVSPDKSFIARKAMELLTAKLTGKDVAPATYLAPHKLVIRESTGGSPVN